MRKILLLFLSFCTMSMVAQDMKSVFIAMPDSVAPLLTKVNKEDCVDFLDSNMKAEVTNRLGGKAEMKTLTDDYMLMHITSNSTLEMKLLPVNDSVKIICMVKTVGSSAYDSEIDFYTSDWTEKLDVRMFLQQPEPETFYLPCDTITEEVALIRKKADMHLMKASLSEDATSLTYIYTTPDYLNKEDREKLLRYVRKEPVVLRWENGKFIR